VTRPAVPVTERSPEPGRSRQITETTGLARALVGAAAGASMPVAVATRGLFLNATVAVLSWCRAVIAFGVMACALDRGDLRAVMAPVRGRAAS
jgi:hypothetical protein